MKTLPPELQRYRLLDEHQVAVLTGRGLQSLRNDRHCRRGFPYVKFGRSVRYKLKDVLASIESGRINPEAL